MGRLLATIGTLGAVVVAAVAVAMVVVLPRATGPTLAPFAPATGSALGSPSTTVASPSVGPAGTAVAIGWSLVTPTGMVGAEITGIGGVGAGGCCLVVGSTSRGAAAWGSADGHTFSSEKAPTERGARLADAELNGNVPGESTFVIVGSDCGAGQDRCTAAAWWTADPDVGPWSRSAFDEPPGSLSEMLGVGVGGPAYVAVGTVVENGQRLGAAWTSADGKRWSRSDAPVLGPGPGVKDVVGGRAIMVAVGASASNGAAWTSLDGRTWNAVSGDPFGRAVLDSVTWVGDRFLAVGNGPSGPGMWTSPDGQAWTPVTNLPHLAFISLRGVAETTPNVFAIGESGGSPTIILGCCTR